MLGAFDRILQRREDTVRRQTVVQAMVGQIIPGRHPGAHTREDQPFAATPDAFAGRQQAARTGQVHPVDAVHIEHDITASRRCVGLKLPRHLIGAAEEQGALQFDDLDVLAVLKQGFGLSVAAVRSGPAQRAGVTTAHRTACHVGDEDRQGQYDPHHHGRDQAQRRGDGGHGRHHQQIADPLDSVNATGARIGNHRGQARQIGHMPRCGDDQAGQYGRRDLGEQWHRQQRNDDQEAAAQQRCHARMLRGVARGRHRFFHAARGGQRAEQATGDIGERNGKEIAASATPLPGFALQG